MSSPGFPPIPGATPPTTGPAHEIQAQAPAYMDLWNRSVWAHACARCGARYETPPHICDDLLDSDEVRRQRDHARRLAVAAVVAWDAWRDARDGAGAEQAHQTLADTMEALRAATSRWTPGS